MPGPDLSNADYDRLVSYIASGVAAYRNKECSLILYPGVPGTGDGLLAEGFEGFARTAPLFAAWLSSGRPPVITLMDGEQFPVLDHLVSGMVAGTDATSSSYWGDISDLDRRIVDSADVALSLWLLRDVMPSRLSAEQTNKILAWLSGAYQRKIYGGNWHLFPLIVLLVARTFGSTVDPKLLEFHYGSFKEGYVGDGWFGDGGGGKIDFYNAWQMHYYMHWINQIDPAFDPDFIGTSLRAFCDNYRYFFSPNGVPMFGRSLCYRMAAPTPLVIAAQVAPDLITPGLGRRALDAVWGYFVRSGALCGGWITQGYLCDDPELLENYSGRASCFWGLRSLVVAYAVPPSSGIWAAAPEPLPVEVASFDLTVPGPGFRVIGEHDALSIELRIARNASNRPIGLHRMPMWRRLAQHLLRRPLRLDNFGAKYDRPVYRSDRPLIVAVDRITPSP